MVAFDRLLDSPLSATMAMIQAISTGQRSRRSAVASRSPGVRGARRRVRSGFWACVTGAASMGFAAFGGEGGGEVFRAGGPGLAAAQPQEDEAEDHHGHQPAEAGVMRAEAAGHVADDDHRDHAGDDRARGERAARAPPGGIGRGVGSDPAGRGQDRGSRALRQVGEERAEVTPGPGPEGLAGAVVEFLERRPAWKCSLSSATAWSRSASDTRMAPRLKSPVGVSMLLPSLATCGCGC